MLGEKHSKMYTFKVNFEQHLSIGENSGQNFRLFSSKFLKSLKFSLLKFEYLRVVLKSGECS